MQTSSIKTTDDTEIEVFENTFKTISISILCFTFAACGIFIIADEQCGIATKMIGGWLNILFFGLGGLFILGSALYKKMERIPSLIIRDDCVCVYVQIKNKYDVIMFSDIDGFRLTKLYRTKMILIDYKPATMTKELERSSPIIQDLMASSLNTVNAIKSISTTNLAVSTENLCAILNSKIKKQRKSGMMAPSRRTC